MLLDGIRNWVKRKVCPGCDHECDRLDRATKLHAISVDAVKAARRKQAPPLERRSDHGGSDTASDGGPGACPIGKNGFP